jgi:hypothetical protein
LPDKRCKKILEQAIISKIKYGVYRGKEITLISTGKMV